MSSSQSQSQSQGQGTHKRSRRASSSGSDGGAQLPTIEGAWVDSFNKFMLCFVVEESPPTVDKNTYVYASHCVVRRSRLSSFPLSPSLSLR